MFLNAMYEIVNLSIRPHILKLNKVRPQRNLRSHSDINPNRNYASWDYDVRCISIPRNNFKPSLSDMDCLQSDSDWRKGLSDAQTPKVSDNEAIQEKHDNTAFGSWDFDSEEENCLKEKTSSNDTVDSWFDGGLGLYPNSWWSLRHSE